MADKLTIGSIIGGAAIVGAAIFVEKPAPEVDQLPCAVVTEITDSKIVNESVYRPQVGGSIDSCFRPGDVYRKVLYRNDSIISDTKTTIDKKNYPENGNVLKVYDYTQWVESLPK